MSGLALWEFDRRSDFPPRYEASLKRPARLSFQLSCSLMPYSVLSDGPNPVNGKDAASLKPVTCSGLLVTNQVACGP